NPLATVAVDLMHNPVSFTAGLAAGTHDFVAVYNGSKFFAASTSGDVTVLVPPPPVAAPPPPVVDPPPPVQLPAVVSVLVVRRRRGGLQQTLLIFNPGGALISGPFYLVLDGLPKGVQWKNASGKVSPGHVHAGSPYLLLPLGLLEPGQSLSVDLSF